MDGFQGREKDTIIMSLAAWMHLPGGRGSLVSCVFSVFRNLIMLLMLLHFGPAREPYDVCVFLFFYTSDLLPKVAALWAQRFIRVFDS